ncbi:MAG TPA: hypothetical protein VK464_15330 [Symbiobacteriaceae bacterium]|nr:hypothetical protein [Symbiobacteriaceae bacterium]
MKTLQRTASAQKPQARTTAPEPSQQAATSQGQTGIRLTGGNQANQAALRQYLQERNSSQPAPPRAAAPQLTMEEELQLQSDVATIARLMPMDQSPHQRDQYIMLRVRHWAELDRRYSETTGSRATPYMDRFLQRTKMKTVNMGDWIADRHMLLYDALWHFVEDPEYKTLAKRSSTEAVPPAQPQESGWSAVGKMAGVGALGFVQGASSAMAGVVDGATWLTSGITGYKSNLGGWVGKQYNDLGNELFDEHWNAKAYMGWSASEMSAGVGNIALSIALSMAGNVTWLKGAQLAKANTALKWAGTISYALTNAKGIGTAVDNLLTVYVRLEHEARQKGRSFGLTDAFQSAEFNMELINAVTNVFGAVMGIPSNGLQTRALKAIAVGADVLAAGGMANRLWEIYQSDATSEEKQVQARQVICDLIIKIGTMSLGGYGYYKEYYGNQAPVTTEAAVSPAAPAPQPAAPAPAPKVKQPRVDRRKQNGLIRDEIQTARANQKAAEQQQVQAARTAEKRLKREAREKVRAETEAKNAALVEAELKARAAAEATPPTPAHPEPRKDARVHRRQKQAEEQAWHQAVRSHKEEAKQSSGTTPPASADPRARLLREGLHPNAGLLLAKAGIRADEFPQFGIHTKADAEHVAQLVRDGLQPKHLKRVVQEGLTVEALKGAGLSGKNLNAGGRLVEQFAGRLNDEATIRLEQQHSSKPAADPAQRRAGVVLYLLNLTKFEQSGVPQYGQVGTILNKAGFKKPEDRALLRAAAQAGWLTDAEKAVLRQVAAHVDQQMQTVGASSEIRQALQQYGAEGDILRLAYMDAIMQSHHAGETIKLPDRFDKRVNRILERHGATETGDKAAMNTMPYEALPGRHQDALVGVREHWEKEMRRAVGGSNGALMHKEIAPGHIGGMLDPKSRFNRAMMSGYWTWDPAVANMNTPAEAFHSMALGYLGTGVSPNQSARYFLLARVGPGLAENFAVPISSAMQARAPGLAHAGPGNPMFPSTLNGHLSSLPMLPEWTYSGAAAPMPDGTRLMAYRPGGKPVTVAEVVNGRWVKKSTP